MRVTASTLRGPGVEVIQRYETVKTETLSLESRRRPYRTGDGELKVKMEHSIEIGRCASMTVDELSIILEFLRSKGIEPDPLRDKQRKIAAWLAQSFEPPRAEAAAEAAD